MGTGWSLAFFAACAVLGAGAAGAAVLGERRRAPVRALFFAGLAAAVLFAAGNGAALLALGRPELVFGILANPSTGLFREFAASAAAAGAMLLYAFARRRSVPARAALGLAGLGAFLSLAAVAAVGTVLFMPWRTGWHTLTAALPLIGLGLAAALPAAGLLDEVSDSGQCRGEALLTTGLPLAGASVWLVALAFGAAPTDAPTAARLLTGDLARPFWGGFVLFGALLPGLLEMTPAAATSGKAARVAALLSLGLAAASAAQLVEVLGGAAGWSFFSP